MATAPAVPQITPPSPVDLPTQYGQLSQQGFQMRQDMVQSKVDARENEWQKLQSDWQNKKLKDKQFVDSLATLASSSDSIVEQKKWEMRATAAKSSVFQKNIQVQQSKIDALSYKAGVNPMDVYNKYSLLAKAAAAAGFEDVAASLLVTAAQAVNRMKNEALSNAATSAALARDQADKNTGSGLNDINNNLIYGHTGAAPSSSSGGGGMSLVGGGALIPSQSAAGGFIKVK